MSKDLPGSFGARNGARWSQSWAIDRRRAEDRSARHATASLQETITPPSAEALRSAVEAEMCPFCGAGPYKSLGLHTNRAHGVSAAELREMSGLKTICSEELSIGSRERLARRPDRQTISIMGGKESIRRQKEAGRTLGREDMTAVLAASLAPRMAAMEERDPIIAARALAGDRLGDIAADLGITTMTVQRSLGRLGITPTLEQTNAERRARLKAAQEDARAARERRDSDERTKRLGRFNELGGDWRAVEALAAECEVSEKAMRAFLRKWGATLPDGRAVTHRRQAERPSARGKPNRAARAVTDAQIEEIRRLSRETKLSQREIGARFGVSQSIVSRVIRGRYVG